MTKLGGNGSADGSSPASCSPPKQVSPVGGHWQRTQGRHKLDVSKVAAKFDPSG